MSTKYPNQIDGLTELPLAVDKVTEVRAEVVNNLRNAIVAIESELGIDPSREFGTVRDRLDAMEAEIADLRERIENLEVTGGGAVRVQHNGTTIVVSAATMNFTGTGINVLNDGSNTARLVFDGGVGSVIEQVQEELTVPIDGYAYYTLSQVPQDSTAVQLFVNGIKQDYGTDYSAVGTIITYAGSVPLLTTDLVEAWYIVSGSVSSSGGETLAQTLAIGNQTGGSDIELSVGDTIISTTGTVVVDDNLSVIGKLSVTGLIDPTGLVLNEQSAVPDTPASGKGIVWVDNSTSPNRLVFTAEDGSATYLSGTGSISDLNSVLAIGNTTGGYDIIISTGDSLQLGTNPSSSGDIRLTKSGTINARKSDNLSDLNIASYDGADTLSIGDAANTATYLTGGAIYLDGYTQVSNDLFVSGKLTVTGLIDPTGLVLNEQASLPTAAASGKGIVWLDGSISPNRLAFTAEDGSTTYLSGIGTSNNLSTVLSNGNTTDGYDITLSSGSNLVIAETSTSSIIHATRTSNNATNNLTIQAQNAYTSATGSNRDGGDLVFSSGTAASGGTDGYMRFNVGATEYFRLDPSFSGIYSSVSMVFDYLATTLLFSGPLSDSAPSNIDIQGQSAWSGATTNLNGGHLNIAGGPKTGAGLGGSVRLKAGGGPTVLEVDGYENIGLFGASLFGGGTRVLSIGSVNTLPTTSDTGQSILWNFAGTLSIQGHIGVALVVNTTEYVRADSNVSALYASVPLLFDVGATTILFTGPVSDVAPSNVDIQGQAAWDSAITHLDGGDLNIRGGPASGAGVAGSVKVKEGSGAVIVEAAAGSKLGFFGTPPVVQQTGGAATASGSYTGTEQTMLQTAYDCLRAFGLLS